MVADWKKWEGQLVNGEFPLLRLLGGSEAHAVFLVEKRAGVQSQTAIRFVDAGIDGADEQLHRWEAASKLEHPNLLRILQTGRCEIDGKSFLYAWTEYGEEELSQILPGRALTIAETQQILEAVLAALSYLHGQGLVHGGVKPSNIFAVGETVKISSDTVRASGKPPLRLDTKSAHDAPEVAQGVAPAADVWSLGVTLVEALTQRLPPGQGHASLPEGIPQPFKEIIENCLQIDRENRWTVAQIAARMKGGKPQTATPAAVAAPARQPARPEVRSPIGSGRKLSAKWLYVLVAAAVIIAAVLIARPKSSRSSSETPPSAQTQSESPPAPANPTPAVVEQRRGSTNAESAPAPSQAAGPDQGNPGSDQMLTVDSRDDILQRVAPRVSPSARLTITGMIRVRVRVNVDAAGNVTEARLQSPGPSKYFARVALDAARGWKFKPAVTNGQAVASQWIVRFGFSRRSTESAAERTRP
jgi:TonB family protein